MLRYLFLNLIWLNALSVVNILSKWRMVVIAAPMTSVDIVNVTYKEQ